VREREREREGPPPGCDASDAFLIDRPSLLPRPGSSTSPSPLYSLRSTSSFRRGGREKESGPPLWSDGRKPDRPTDQPTPSNTRPPSTPTRLQRFALILGIYSFVFSFPLSLPHSLSLSLYLSISPRLFLYAQTRKQCSRTASRFCFNRFFSSFYTTRHFSSPRHPFNLQCY
jgi:hypothetical protein